MTQKKKYYTRRHANWMVDYDYTSKLDKKSEEWLLKFTNEYYRNGFNPEDSVHDLSAPKTYELLRLTETGTTMKKGTVKQELMYADLRRKMDLFTKFDRSDSSLLIESEHCTDIEDAIIEAIDSAEVERQKEIKDFEETFRYYIDKLTKLGEIMSNKMTKAQFKDINRMLDLLLNLLETGVFPGRRAPQLLDAASFITSMKDGHKQAYANQGGQDDSEDTETATDGQEQASEPSQEA